MSVKTEKQIERDFYTLIKASRLGKGVRGTVYRSEMRPANAKTEDVIVKFLAGLDEQIQTGVVIVNVYVPDVPYGNDGRKVEDKGRVEELEKLILDFVENFSDADYWIETDGTPKSTQIEGIEQHCIYARIKFNRLT